MSDEQISEFTRQIERLTAFLKFTKVLFSVLSAILVALFVGFAWITSTDTQLKAQGVELSKLHESSVVAHKRYDELLARLTAITEQHEGRLNRVEVRRESSNDR